MTPSELDKIEQNFDKLKPSRKSFISRYGKDAEKVMRSVATKQSQSMDKNKIKEMVKMALTKPQQEEINSEAYLSSRKQMKEGATLSVDFVDDDWSESIARKIAYKLKELGMGNDKVKAIGKAMSTLPSLMEGTANPTDIITMDVPLFLRMLEYAKEDAKTDMDLHDVTEMATTLSAEDRILTMADYDSIVKNSNEIDEKKLTAAEKRKKEDIVKGMKKSFKGNEAAMYAIATDKAKKLAETILSKLKDK